MHMKHLLIQFDMNIRNTKETLELNLGKKLNYYCSKSGVCVWLEITPATYRNGVSLLCNVPSNDVVLIIKTLVERV